MKNQHGPTYYGGQLNTLAQSGTNYLSKPAVIVPGKGSELTNNKALQGRAKRKTITQRTMLSLIDVNDKYGSAEQKKAFWNTYHCQNKLLTIDGRYYGKYCKNRFCTLCCSIRKAKITNSYLPTLRAWEGACFVTLTIKSVPADRLRKLLKKVLLGFQLIKDKYRKRNLRGKGIKLMGVKSLECNFNPKTKTYNPHLHIIVENRTIADILKKEWLNLWKDKWTYQGAQKIRKVENTERDLIEIIKYGTKVFTEPDVRKKIKAKGQSKIYVAALYNIQNAMKGLRLFERFGFDLPKVNPQEEISPKVVNEYAEWFFHPEYHDWLNSETGHCLTNYEPEAELLHLLENNVDVDLE